jgi:hypothetical protein
MDWKAKALAVYGWARKTMGTIIDPPPGAIGWYILAVLAIAIGGNVLFNTLFQGPKTPPAIAVAKRPVYALPPLSVITTVPPAKTATAPDAKPKKKLYRKPACRYC